MLACAASTDIYPTIAIRVNRCRRPRAHLPSSRRAHVPPRGRTVAPAPFPCHHPPLRPLPRHHRLPRRQIRRRTPPRHVSHLPALPPHECAPPSPAPPSPAPRHGAPTPRRLHRPPPPRRETRCWRCTGSQLQCTGSQLQSKAQLRMKAWPLVHSPYTTAPPRWLVRPLRPRVCGGPCAWHSPSLLSPTPSAQRTRGPRRGRACACASARRGTRGRRRWR